MNKYKAKKVLTKQKVKLNGGYVLGDFAWLSTTRHYIEHIFSKDSEPYTVLNAFRPIDEKDPLYLETKGRLNNLLDQWIEIIAHGTYCPPPKPNFFKHFSNEHLVWVLPLIATALVTMGYLIGTSTTDFKIDTKERENKVLKDSINILHTILSKSSPLKRPN